MYKEKNNDLLSEHRVKIFQISFLKEFDFEECCVKNNLLITFEDVNEKSNIIHNVKCYNATPFFNLLGFTEYSMTVYDVSSLGFESYHYKVSLLHDEKKFEILCDLIEPVYKVLEMEKHEMIPEEDISGMNRMIGSYNFIKSLHFKYFNDGLSEFIINITQDSYMLDADSIGLILDNPIIEELKYIEYMYSLNFTLDLYSQEKHCKYLMIAEIDDMVNSIEVLSESVKLIKYYENKTEEKR